LLARVAGTFPAPAPLTAAWTVCERPLGRGPAADACTLPRRAEPEGDDAGTAAAARVEMGAKPVGGRKVSVSRRTRTSRGKSGPGSAAAARNRPAATAVCAAPCVLAADAAGIAPPSRRRSTPPGVGCAAAGRSAGPTVENPAPALPAILGTEVSEAAPTPGACTLSRADPKLEEDAEPGATLRRSAGSVCGAEAVRDPVEGAAATAGTEPPETAPVPGACTLSEREVGPERKAGPEVDAGPAGEAGPTDGAGRGLGRGAGTPPRAGLRRSPVTDSCRPAQARRSKPARPWVRLGGRLPRLVDPRVMWGTAPDSGRCASPSPGACPGPAPDGPDPDCPASPR
jgi:hypothetical protein